MSEAKAVKGALPALAGAQLLARLLEEGYGPGAWHGPDLKAALADVSPELAFWRPAPGRHNIAEIALHHAYCVRSVLERFTGVAQAPFVLQGSDWFELDANGSFSWEELRKCVDGLQNQLAAAVAETGVGRASSPFTEKERLDLLLGITCHAVYHAGQVQLIKKLRAK